VMALSGTYGKLLDFVMFVTVLFYIVTVLGIFVLRRKRPEAPRPYRAIGYPYLPALYIVLAAGVCVALVLHPATRGSSLIGLAIVAAGVPVYHLLKRSGSTARAPTGVSPS
jgi:basic amino acid/polyamine antiporter, APA family